MQRQSINFIGALIALWGAVSAQAEIPSAVPNGGFERTIAGAGGADRIVGWKPFGDGGFVVDTAQRHTGRVGARCHNATALSAASGLTATVVLNEAAARPIVVSGWSKAASVDGSADTDYAVFVDLTYADGSKLYAQAAPFETGTHGWQRRHVTILPSRPVRSLELTALFRNHGGTAWFDDFAVHTIASDALFDSQTLAAPSLAASIHGGWFVRDVAANGPVQPLAVGRRTSGLRLDGLHTARAGKIVGALLRNLTGRSRAVTVYYADRFSAADPVWWNDVRDAVPARAEQEYGNLTPVGYGAVGQISLYQWGCVTGDRAGRALGIPPALGPRAARIVFNRHARLLFLACDVTLAASGDPSHHDVAPIGVARFRVDPRWGFRSAAAGYYALFPEAFTRRAHAEGIWMPFTAPSKVANVGDFHIAYHEGDNDVAGDRRRHILSFRYVEPMTYWMPMPPSVPRTYDAALAYVRRKAAGDPSLLDRKDSPKLQQRQAQAVLYSGSQTIAGRYNVAFRDAPWCNGAVWVLNPNPRMTHPTGAWTKADLNSAGEPIPGKPGEPDGEYLDSLEFWAGIMDYRPESLRKTVYSPTFTPDEFRPGLPTWFSVYEGTAALARDLHARHHLLMANAVPWQYSAFEALLDVQGTETTMFDSRGDWEPEPDARMNLRRAVSYHKPYLLLLNTDFSKVDSAKVALYFQRCLFYGIYPSFYSVNAADHPYWEDPRLYDRDRPLFKKYIPLLQRISAAGWEPVTWAHSSRPSVWLERYGTTYLTVLNSERTPSRARIEIEVSRLFPGGPHGRAETLTVQDAMTGQTLCVTPARPVVAVPLALQGSQTRVLSLRVSRP